MEKILHNGKLVALKINAFADGSIPMTSPEEALQVMTLKHPKGRHVTPHRHVPHRRETNVLQECLVVISGKLRISFFENDEEAFTHVDIAAGEACLTLSGAHGVEFLEDSEVIEVKNGPFIDDKEPFSAQR
ncbi:MAG: hypothetical protein NUV90_02325 [Candidatus Parcubacteria bacterium]|nr:hypothetical protein [Candidatus Parcubacteria bacterium]